MISCGSRVLQTCAAGAAAGGQVGELQVGGRGLLVPGEGEVLGQAVFVDRAFRCRVDDDTVLIHPSDLQPSARPLTPADTRTAAVCLVAALAVPGRTTITGIEHLQRGYERLVPRLTAAGASIDVAELAPCGV